VSAPLEYGWREAGFEIMRDGFYGLVERWWCDGTDEGWRWHCFNSADIQGSSTDHSGLMPLEEAKRHVEEWIAEQIEKTRGLKVYAFAGLEPTPQTHFSIDGDLVQTIEDGPERADCPCPTCGAKFRPTSERELLRRSEQERRTPDARERLIDDDIQF
jgi:hypothetical protein